jgi:hypothetical protein
MANPNPNKSTRFGAGQVANPGGKPVNARNQVTKKLLEVLAKDFDKNGETAIVRMREEDPSGYVRTIASLLPKEFVIERPLDGLSDDELAASIAFIRERVAALTDASAGVGEAPVGESVSELHTVQ